MSGIYQAYLAKKAADEGFDPILQHPNLAAKPKNLDELSDRRMRMQSSFAAGGALGALGGLGASALAMRRNPALAAHGPAVHTMGAIGGAVLGGSVGMGLNSLRNFVGKVQRHDAAAKSYEGRTGQSLPWDVRHPYVSNALLHGGASLGGAAVGHLLTRGQPELGALGYVAGSLAGEIGAQAVHPLLQQRRNEMFRGRVNQQQLADSVLDEDKLDEEAMRGM